MSSRDGQDTLSSDLCRILLTLAKSLAEGKAFISHCPGKHVLISRTELGHSERNIKYGLRRERGMGVVAQRNPHI